MQGTDLGDCDMRVADFKGTFGISKDTNLSLVRNLDNVKFVTVTDDATLKFDGFRTKAIASEGTVKYSAGCCGDHCCAPTAYGSSDSKDVYGAIVTMPFYKSFVVYKEYLAIRVKDDDLAKHKDQLEFGITELLEIRAMPITKENWSGFLATYKGLYDLLDSLIQHGGSKRLIEVLGKIIFDEEAAEGARNWETPRKTFLTMMLLKNGYSKAPPMPGVIAAMELGLKEPFRRAEFFDELNELKGELGYIAAITASKERVGLLMSQVSLSALFGVSSFLAQWAYENFDLVGDLVGNTTAFDDDDEYRPIVNALQSSDSTAENQQQIIQLLTALLNATTTGN